MNKYDLYIKSSIYKKFKKLSNKDKVRLKAIDSKIKEICKNPYAFKPLKKPLQNKRGVHIGPFVIVYEIDEKKKTVIISNYKHHDDIYKI